MKKNNGKFKFNLRKSLLIFAIVIIALILLFTPKLIDLMFSASSCPIFIMNKIDASDVLNYFGVVVTITIAVASALVTIKQFRILNKTNILPLNKTIYYYANVTFAPAFLSGTQNIESEDVEELSRIRNDFNINLSLKNIGKGTAETFTIAIDYKKGSYYKELIKLLGNEKYEGIKSNFESEVYADCGIFNTDETKSWYLPTTLKLMIECICHLQYQNQIDNKSINNNCLIRQKHKLAEIKIEAKDIVDIIKSKNVFVYDLFVSLDSSCSICSSNGLYSKISITFSKHKKDNIY